MVDFFYVDKLLRPGGVVALDDVNYPNIRKLCRYVVTNLPYEVVPSSNAPPPPQPSWRKRVLLGMPVLSKYAKRLESPRFSIQTRRSRFRKEKYPALRKQREVVLGDGTGGSRHWDFHREF
jgi:hypothetical protein